MPRLIDHLKGKFPGQGRAGQGRAGQAGRAGQGRAGQGRAGQGRAGQGRAGQGAGQGRAGQGRQGRAGQGRAGQGQGRALETAANVHLACRCISPTQVFTCHSIESPPGGHCPPADATSVGSK